MLNTLNKKLQTGLLLGALSLSSAVFAQPEGNILEQIRELLQQENGSNEEVQRELFQDMKGFMGLTNLKNLETQNVMRLLLPPAIDETMTIGSRMLAAQDAIIPWQESLVRDTANYNMNTSKEKSDDTSYLKKRLEEGSDLMLDPYKGLNDLMATTLLNGYAFKNDQQAEDAYLFIRNLTNFKPISSMAPEEMFLDEEQTTLTDAGADHLMKLYKQLPAMTMAQNSLLAIHAEKQRFQEFAQGLPGVGDPETKSASLMEVMAYEVERRYMNADWSAQMNQLSTEALLKEIANMMAFQSYVDFKRYDQGMRSEALLAGLVGILSGMMTDQMPDDIATEGLFEEM